MSRWIVVAWVFCSGVALAAEPAAPPDVESVAPVVPADPLAGATRLRQDARAGRIAPVAVFARTEVSPAWKRYASVAAARAGGADAVDDLISVFDGVSGVQLVVNEPSSMGDNSDRIEYVYAPNGALVQFARVSLGWGDVCGNVREEVVVDFVSPVEARRGYAVRFNDGKPFSAAQLDADCPHIVHPETAQDPGYQPSWRSFSAVPVADALR